MRAALNIRTNSCSHFSTSHSDVTAQALFPGRASAVRIGSRWPVYQGLNNWVGLLDPLDPALSSEILRYGEFVRAAYACFDCDPSSPSYATCRFPKQSLLPESTGYRVIRNLHASSGAELPRWADDISPAWASRRSSWIGYVAVCSDEEEIARLGRRDVVIAYRGTVTCMEWLENLRATLTRLPSAAAAMSVGSSPDPMVEKGFWSLFTSCGISYRSLRDQVRILKATWMNH